MSPSDGTQPRPSIILQWEDNKWTKINDISFTDATFTELVVDTNSISSANEKQRNTVNDKAVDSANTTQNKRRKLKNACYYCEEYVTNFARHVVNNHCSEIDVIKLRSLPLQSLERKRLLTRLRNKGNYLKTANDVQRRVRRSQIPGTSALPCANCLGFFSSKLLYRHRQRCTGKKGPAQSEGQNALIRHIKVDERLRKEVFPRMRPDKISLEAKSDRLICAFGARYLRLHRAKHFAVVTSRKMRELSKILMELKKLNPEIKSMLQALKPMYFDLFVQATQIVARYEPTNDSYVSPSFAMNIVNSFKQCCDIAISYVVKESVPAAEAESQLRTMHQLFTSNWRFEISSHAADTLNLNKWNNITIVPLASDLKLMRDHLLTLADKSIKSLCIDNKDASAFNILVETIYCRVLLLNRKRPGELQRMLLQTYLNSSSNKGQYEEFESIVTPSERILLNKFKRVVIRGKRNRGVPVLFSDDVQGNIKVMLEVRSNFIPKENLFLFAKANSSVISGYKVLKKYAYQCGAKNPFAITSTRLRKHLATVTQLFNMTDVDIEQLATFMGHTSGVHRGSYRLPDDVFQTAKLSKLLLLMEKGQASQYKGKNLEEIEIDLEENLLNEREENESIEEPDEADAYDEEHSLDNTVTETQAVPELKKDKESDNQQQRGRKKRLLIPWTEEQKRLATTHFAKHIKNSKPPRKHECDELIDAYPNIFHNKEWSKIKVFVQNQYCKKK
nr:unnamed protein product [Callosobruchus analis]